eukprot:795606-Prymnesium_polylepis.1
MVPHTLLAHSRLWFVDTAVTAGEDAFAEETSLIERAIVRARYSKGDSGRFGRRDALGETAWSRPAQPGRCAREFH